MNKPMRTMKNSIAFNIAGLALAFGIGTACAAEQESVAQPDNQVSFSVLQGTWVRPDGGYVITIKAVEAGGKLDAAYANPNPLPFSKAEASREGKTIKVFFELSAGGYNGSTYTLVYDPTQDILAGVYYQAVAQQKYDIYFERAKH